MTVLVYNVYNINAYFSYIGERYQGRLRYTVRHTIDK